MYHKRSHINCLWLRILIAHNLFLTLGPSPTSSFSAFLVMSSSFLASAASAAFFASAAACSSSPSCLNACSQSSVYHLYRCWTPYILLFFHAYVNEYLQNVIILTFDGRQSMCRINKLLKVET